MSVIFVISPTYLESLYKEALKYDFKLQGYGNVTNALKGLFKTNVSDIIGFAYVNTRLPTNLAHLKYFMSLCGMCCEYSGKPKKFMFALHDFEGITDLFDRDFGNLDFSYLTLETMTDVEINRGIFGSILKNNYNPYELGLRKEDVNSYETTPDNLTKNDLLALHDSFPVLSFHHAINPYYLQVFNSYNRLGSLDETVNQDEIYQDFSLYNKRLAELRRIYINLDYIASSLNTFNLIDSIVNNRFTEKLKIFRNRVEILISKLREITIDDEDGDRFILYKSIIYLLEKKCLELHCRLYQVGGVK